MKGLFILLLVVIVTVDTVRSQMRPPTRTKKGKRPARLGDNTDRGLPSGADVPDGRRFGPPAFAAAPRAAAPAAPPAAPAMGVPYNTRPAAPAGAPRRPGDNTDRGLPSGKDVPDGRRFAPVPAAGGPPPPAAPRAGPPPPAAMPPTRTRSAAAPPPPAAPAAAAAPPPPARRLVAAAPPPPAAGGMPPTRTRSGARPATRFNDNPDFGLPSGRDYPDAGFGPMPAMPPAMPAMPPAMPAMPPAMPAMPPAMPAMPPAMPAQPAPPMSCEAKCPAWLYQPACAYSGNTYDNDCYLYCSGDVKDCDGQCPCESPVAPVAPVVDTCGCGDNYDPVCVEDDVELRNECVANCDANSLEPDQTPGNPASDQAPKCLPPR